MKCFLFIILFITSSNLLFGQQTCDSLAKSLAYRVLRNATEVEVAGDAGTPPSVIAFNIIYRSSLPEQNFKNTFLRSNIAGKFYCLLGLFLLTDSEYEKYKTLFLSLKTEDGIWFRAGSRRIKYKDLNELLDIWIDGFYKKVWFTEALIIK